MESDDDDDDDDDELTTMAVNIKRRMCNILAKINRMFRSR